MHSQPGSSAHHAAGEVCGRGRRPVGGRASGGEAACCISRNMPADSATESRSRCSTLRPLSERDAGCCTRCAFSSRRCRGRHGPRVCGLVASQCHQPSTAHHSAATQPQVPGNSHGNHTTHLQLLNNAVLLRQLVLQRCRAAARPHVIKRCRQVGTAAQRALHVAGSKRAACTVACKMGQGQGRKQMSDTQRCNCWQQPAQQQNQCGRFKAAE